MNASVNAGVARDTLTAADVIAHANTLGFDPVGITPLGLVDTAPYFDAWIEAGYAGEMAYLPRGQDKRHDSRLPYPGTTTAIVVALNYGGAQPSGPIARYARGNDYHDVMIDKLRALHQWIDARVGHPVHGKAYVDTGPLLERDLARRAGLGWFGKNTNLIHPRRGSFFFLGSLLLDLELEASAPFATDHCGTCTRCLDACPTHALTAPHVLDATRCISYLTIELRGPIPTPLRPAIGELVYGCDICQEVCPFNRKFASPPTEPELAPRPETTTPDLVELLRMTTPEWQTFTRGSPIKRAKRRGLLRNVAVTLGNRGDASAVPALIDALADDEPLVRGHAAWALGAIDTPEARTALEARLSIETDEMVLAEIHAAIAAARDIAPEASTSATESAAASLSA